ncbi:MAG: chaperone NapD [Desulfocapsaceae bacterium]
MPIGGVVITCRAELSETVLRDLKSYSTLEIHGADDKGNIVAVIDSETSEEMETLIDTINKHEHILNVGMTYLNTEDEAEKMARGEKLTKPFGFRKPLEPPDTNEQK